MILLVGVVGGLLAGSLQARWRGQPYSAPAFRFTWLVVAGFIPQLLIAYLPASTNLLPDRLAAVSLMGSLFAFLAFAWLNRGLPGMPVLLVGLLMNLSVMLANGGWMPIAPYAATRIWGADVSRFPSGTRFGRKDVLLLPQETNLNFLADRLLFPAWFPYQVAFSAGDLLIAVGAFWLLASQKTQLTKQEAE